MVLLGFVMKKLFVFVMCLAFVPFHLYAQKWVDMGVRAENGDIIYWSSSDFGLYKNGSAGFVDYGEIGSAFGWGDITGQASGNDLSKYGGANPPNSIEGNPRYDIITAKLGKIYRLPTMKEFQQLVNNCEIKRTTIERKRNVGKDGLPSWVQGQWMWHSSALAGGRTLNTSISLTIDGYLASVYTSDNDYWEGSYTYSKGKLKVWKLDLIVDESTQSIKDDRGYQYQKISNKTESRKLTGYYFKSKINGNTLLFALPPTASAGTAGGGQFTIAWANKQEVDYWTGTLYQQDKECAATFTLNDNGHGITAVPRFQKHRMRAIKVDVGSGKRLAEEKRIAEQKAAEERARQEELERQRAEAERLRLEQLRAEAYANDPIIKGLSLFDTKDKTAGIFDYKMYIEVPNTYGRPQKRGILLLFYSNKNTKVLYQEFWRCINSGESYKEHRQFVEEKFGETLPNIVKCLNDFSIVDADGHTYTLKLDEALPKAFEQKEWLRFQVEGSSRNATCILRPVLDGENVGKLTIGTVNLSVFPFLQKEHSKGEKLYYCDFELPFSSSYSIIANDKTIKGDIVDYSVFWQLKSGKNENEIRVRGTSNSSRNDLQQRANDNEHQRQMNRRSTLYQEERNRMQKRNEDYQRATEQRRRMMQQNK